MECRWFAVGGWCRGARLCAVGGLVFRWQNYNFFVKEKNILGRIFQQFFGWVVDKFCNLRSIKEIGIFLSKVKGKKTKKR
jgi:hypothetical protein